MSELAINVRSFRDFLKTFKKSCNIKRMRNKYKIIFIGQSRIDTGEVSREIYSGFV